MKESDEKWDLGNLEEGWRTGSPDNTLQLLSCSHSRNCHPAGGGRWSLQQPQPPLRRRWCSWA